MAEIFIAVLSGFLFGIALCLFFLPFLMSRIIKKEQFNANLDLYRQLLQKKKDRHFEYSQNIRKVINSVHVALLVEHQNTLKDSKIEPNMARCEPSL